MESFTLNGLTIKYVVRKAVVGHIETVTNTNTHGSTYGRVSTNIQQTFYLEDEDKKQSVVKLTDWDVSALTGHELVLIWVETSEKKGYALVHNKTLGLSYHGKYSDFFKQYPDYPFAIYAIASLPAILISCFFYGATRSTPVGFVVFLLVGGVTMNYFRKQTGKKNNSIKCARDLKIKLGEILKAIT
ncbi:MAG: hypothetical protein PSV16_00630 [Flavobacterium sp.]|nr:hypothetical protein [Flavobacterium sp.]